MGPLDAHKINSFTRTLIGVRDLADKFGGVYFDSERVYVVSEVDGSIMSTAIGDATAARLYSFDLEALEEHAGAIEVK